MVHSLGRLRALPAVRRLLRARPAFFAAIIPIHLFAAEIRGVVVDAMGGEPLARVRIDLLNTDLRTTTDPQGHFRFASVPAGNYTLHVETVGYRLLNRVFALAQDETKEFQIVLSPETFRRTDTINVTADPFGATEAASPAELALTGNEVETLSSVLAADPLRAVQSLPGVVATNDFYSQFSVLGAPYSRIGFYLDDALLHSPFHTAQEISDGASLSVLNGDMIEALSLFPVAFPARYGDRTGSALDVRTRDGSRTRPSVRISAGVSSLTGMAEGPLPPSAVPGWSQPARVISITSCAASRTMHLCLLWVSTTLRRSSVMNSRRALTSACTSLMATAPTTALIPNRSAFSR